jgi:hypothetical protein
MVRAVIHYHGTPITPRTQLERMAGRNFCISFAHPQDLKTCLRIGQSLVFDNGAFSTFTRGHPFDEKGFYKWLAPILAPPHWAVIPDVIGGDVKQQKTKTKRWPYRADLGAPVWHLGLPLSYLKELTNEWPRVCFGSSEEYWKIGSAKWVRRMDEAFNALAKWHRIMPWIHGLRMLGQTSGPWPLASADSTNVGQNFKASTGCAECLAARLDARQPAARWKKRHLSPLLFPAY